MSFYLMHRGWLDHDVFGDPEREPLCKRAAWAWLIDHAEYAVKQVRIGRKLVTLHRGQLSYSLRFLGKSWGWHYLRVRRFLADLAERNMIETVCETARETAQTVLTICNYELYQAPTQEARNSSRDRPRGKRDTNIKEEIRPKESKNLSSPSTESPSLACAREAAPAGQAAPAEEEDFKIPEKWIETVRGERRRRDLPELDLHELARQTENRWRHDPPHNRWLAWRGRALTATLNESLVPSPHRFTEEEEAERQRIADVMVAEIRARRAALEVAA
jgi:hypothetical protein